MSRHPLGLIHGRFQVLHNDHLVYLLAGKALCDHLIVGVTNPTPEESAEEAANPARSAPENNPLSYEERESLIRAAFKEKGIPEGSYEVIPFPICKPEKIREIAPAEAVYYLTIYDAWGHEKRKRLEGLGLRTHVMWERPQEHKGISATDVRRAMRTGGEWRHMVPPAVAALLDEWNIQERLAGSSGS
ncbi:nicotinate-nucleotide adenylyltransferase [Pseudodesulfovibrio cashew]|uniref:Nicotinate-nucleotide adenylyltransferase n=1 Tax=Pseudodesulfovibrio cashew TaxID=2678688 RepID=A0A6I6JNI0_9BACT|nr:nicotinate-nucleotide adenylyltransferase [Pseudodesulfovibrio cashew]QGY41697.1 nicotinate-nucleotide adenylyltransferase [Pseudodesulfovibrio cashew]